MRVHPKRVALAVPDAVGKVSLLRFEKVPPRRRDLDELIRWQVRKAAPFRIEDAQVSYVQVMKNADGSTEFVVVLARKDIIREYEAVCEEAGVQAGIVDPATFNVINSVLAGAAAIRRSPLVHVTHEDATMAILRGPYLLCRAAEEAARRSASNRDVLRGRLSGGGFSRECCRRRRRRPELAGLGRRLPRRTLEQRLNTKVDCHPRVLQPC
jgi:hypothetical protein